MGREGISTSFASKMHFSVVELQYCNELGFLSFLDQPAASEMRSPGSHTSYTHKTITDQVYSALTGIPSQLPASKVTASHPPAPVSHPIAKRFEFQTLKKKISYTCQYDCIKNLVQVC